MRLFELIRIRDVGRDFPQPRQLLRSLALACMWHLRLVMAISRPLVAVFLAPAVLAVWGCTLNGRGTARPVTFDGGQVTVDGCLIPDQDGRMVLSVVKVTSATSDQQSNGAGPGGARIGLSTSLDGPWIGTVVLDLVPEPSVNLSQYRGRVSATGVVEAEAGTTGSVDQMKTERGVRVTSLHVQSLQPAEGDCAGSVTAGTESH
jgi:hypothetical protein